MGSLSGKNAVVTGSNPAGVLLEAGASVETSTYIEGHAKVIRKAAEQRRAVCLVQDALNAAGAAKDEITHWCIHPGGKKILEAVHNSLGFTNGQLQFSYDVLRDYGNMSSCTVLFVLKNIMNALQGNQPNKIFGAAFGPGLTMETFILSNQ